jgi:hypothetical protein
VALGEGGGYAAGRVTKPREEDSVFVGYRGVTPREEDSVLQRDDQYLGRFGGVSNGCAGKPAMRCVQRQAAAPQQATTLTARPAWLVSL